MENLNSIKISIPKPCHEDWNKMTPNEQGSFCGKCCKTVVDFTNKSPEEIRNTLLEQSGKKVCGRFMSNQLDEKPGASINLNIPFYLLPRNISFSKSFGIALFIAFGTTLFSCTTPEDHIVGKISVNDSAKQIITQKVIDSVKKDAPLLGDTVSTIPKKQVLGGVKPLKCMPMQGDVAVEITKGEIKTDPNDMIRTVAKPDTLKLEPKMGKVKVK
ncbi:MAG: hypothetical protein ACXVPY_08200 [Bacteroidia bacterium]